MSIANWSTMDTLIGPFTAIVAEDGAVLASGWTGGWPS
jgi:methylated-DNA-[protein]-cysteine S-methyltransferase